MQMQKQHSPVRVVMNTFGGSFTITSNATGDVSVLNPAGKCVAAFTHAAPAPGTTAYRYPGSRSTGVYIAV